VPQVTRDLKTALVTVDDRLHTTSSWMRPYTTNFGMRNYIKQIPRQVASAIPQQRSGTMTRVMSYEELSHL
jgi:hypothetical protein